MFICPTVLEKPITDISDTHNETKLMLNDIHPNFYLQNRS
jgi:hypothetical protein